MLSAGNDYDEMVISYAMFDDTPQQRPDYYYTEIFNCNGLIRTLNYGNTETVGLVDLNANGYAELIIGDAGDSIKAYDAQNDILLWKQPTDQTQIRSSPVIGNIHPSYDGVEIAFGNDFPKAHLRRGINGYNIIPWPDTTTGASSTSAAIGHLDGDNNLDIMTATQGFYLYAHSNDKTRIAPYHPLPFFSSLSSPVLADINGDRRNEVIIATRDGYLHVLKNTNSRVSQYSVEWPQFHHDYQHTGLFGW